MRRARLSEVPFAPADAAHFSGGAYRSDLVSVDDPPSSGIVVRFEPGGRTHWHRHAAGQYLYVLSGAGRIQSRGEPVQQLLPGDCVYAAPKEEHWHGADEASDLEHLAFSFGATEWAGPADPKSEDSNR